MIIKYLKYSSMAIALSAPVFSHAQLSNIAVSKRPGVVNITANALRTSEFDRVLEKLAENGFKKEEVKLHGRPTGEFNYSLTVGSDLLYLMPDHGSLNMVLEIGQLTNFSTNTSSVGIYGNFADAIYEVIAKIDSHPTTSYTPYGVKLTKISVKGLSCEAAETYYTTSCLISP